MRLWFWQKPKPVPEWAAALSAAQRRVLAENLRAIVEPKKVIERRLVIERSLGSRPLERSAPLR